MVSHELNLSYSITRTPLRDQLSRSNPLRSFFGFQTKKIVATFAKAFDRLALVFKT